MSLIKNATESDAWESGDLGREAEFVRKSNNNSDELDNKLNLQMISIRLQKSLLEDLKNIAELNGIGYQPLIKQVLKRFVDSEKKQILNEKAAEQRNIVLESKKVG